MFSCHRMIPNWFFIKIISISIHLKLSKQATYILTSLFISLSPLFCFVFYNFLTAFLSCSYIAEYFYPILSFKNLKILIKFDKLFWSTKTQWNCVPNWIEPILMGSLQESSFLNYILQENTFNIKKTWKEVSNYYKIKK